MFTIAYIYFKILLFNISYFLKYLKISIIISNDYEEFEGILGETYNLKKISEHSQESQFHLFWISKVNMFGGIWT